MTLLLLQVVIAASLQGKIVVWGSTTPLGQVEVELRRADGSNAKPLVVVTNAQGDFYFANVPPGQYQLVTMRSGFTQGEYRQRRPGGAGSPITLARGQRMTGVTISMAPGGAIAGRLLDKDGQPMPRATVYASRSSYVEGRLTLNNIQSAITDDRGEYRLFWLPPGRYYVSFRPVNGPGMIGGGNMVANPGGSDATFGISPLIRSRPQARNPRPAELEERELYKATYFPGTTELQSAALLNLRAGEEIRDVNVTAMTGKTSAVRVSVLDPSTGSTSVAALVMIAPLIGPPQPVNAVIANPTLPSIVYYLTPGTYEVRAPISTTKSGRAVIHVLDRDLDVTISLASFTVSGSVRIENAPDGFDVQNRQIILRAPPAFRLTGKIAADGTFRVEGVPAGDYEMVVSDDALETMYQTSTPNIRVGSESQTPLEITLSGNGGELAGEVVDEKGKAAADATVVLISNGSSQFKTATTDSNGHFQMRGIAPGEYAVYAWEDVDPGAWLDPNFISIFRKFVTTVSIAAGEKRNIRIPLIPLG